MTETAYILRPIQAFDDNIRPASLMLQVYRLLDCGDAILTEGEFVQRLRELVRASATEDLMVVQNEIFLGLVRERANLPKSHLKSSMLAHLLRQAIVASCTALDAFLPGLLRQHLPAVIAVRGRDFVPQDETIREYCEGLKFSVEEVLRLMGDEKEATLYISNKLLALSNFKYLAEKRGVHVVGALLGLANPWEMIAEHLQRDRRELVSTLDLTVKRRNDIVHRADRPQADLEGDQQPISYAQAEQGVDTIKHVCHALNELVDRSMMTMLASREVR
jgi:hypothetical protein